MFVFHKPKYWAGIIVGTLILGSFFGLEVYQLSQQANVTKNSITISQEEMVNPSLSPTDNIEKFTTPSLSPSLLPRPSSKPTSKPVVASTPPTPTPIANKPLPDYYYLDKIIIHVNGYSEGESTFAQSQNLMGMYAEVGFRNNTTIYGDGDLKLNIYVNGELVSQQSIGKYGDSAYYFKYYPTTQVGTHTVRFVINEGRIVPESNYNNNEVSATYTIIGDNVPPTFSIEGPFIIDGKACLRWVDLSDNNSVYTDVWAKWKIDNGEWSNRTSENPFGCITGEPGSSHTYYVHAEDKNGNISDKSQEFFIY